jgi:cob(I)alamin adenosyltransferase
MAMVQDADIARLETVLDALNEPLPPLKEFILPGGGMAAACGHLARTVCRRAEREVITLAHAETIRPQPQRYLNRLSDLLFVICRVLARAAGQGEVLWQHERRPRG